MKQTIIYLLIATLAISCSSCKKNVTTNPIDQLPPETQTGANTFGCLVDGQVFLPNGDPFGGPIKKASYQFVNGGYYLIISGGKSNDNDISSVSIFSDSLKLSVGTFQLTSRNVKNKLYGKYVFSAIGNSGIYYYTNEIYNGQVKITKLDEVNQIISGTFWFDAADSTQGKVVKVRNGIFDMTFVK